MNWNYPLFASGTKIPNKCTLEGTNEPRVYHACSSNEVVELYNPEVFQYIGKGTIYSVDGVKQNNSEELHFWEYTEMYKNLGV